MYSLPLFHVLTLCVVLKASIASNSTLKSLLLSSRRCSLIRERKDCRDSLTDVSSNPTPEVLSEKIAPTNTVDPTTSLCIRTVTWCVRPPRLCSSVTAATSTRYVTVTYTDTETAFATTTSRSTFTTTITGHEPQRDISIWENPSIHGSTQNPRRRRQLITRSASSRIIDGIRTRSSRLIDGIGSRTSRILEITRTRSCRTVTTTSTRIHEVHTVLTTLTSSVGLKFTTTASRTSTEIVIETAFIPPARALPSSLLLPPGTHYHAPSTPTATIPVETSGSHSLSGTPAEEILPIETSMSSSSITATLPPLPSESEIRLPNGETLFPGPITSFLNIPATIIGVDGKPTLVPSSLPWKDNGNLQFIPVVVPITSFQPNSSSASDSLSILLPDGRLLRPGQSIEFNGQTLEFSQDGTTFKVDGTEVDTAVPLIKDAIIIGGILELPNGELLIISSQGADKTIKYFSSLASIIIETAGLQTAGFLESSSYDNEAVQTGAKKTGTANASISSTSTVYVVLSNQGSVRQSIWYHFGVCYVVTAGFIIFM